MTPFENAYENKGAKINAEERVFISSEGITITFQAANATLITSCHCFGPIAFR